MLCIVCKLNEVHCLEHAPLAGSLQFETSTVVFIIDTVSTNKTKLHQSSMTNDDIIIKISGLSPLMISYNIKYKCKKKNATLNNNEKLSYCIRR